MIEFNIDRKIAVNPKNHLIRNVKKFTNSGHVTLPKTWIGQDVVIFRDVKIKEADENENETED